MDNAGQSDRQLFDVNIDCNECGTHIAQLPFQPVEGRPVFCRECLQAKRNSRPQRQMFDVDVNCAECGTSITQLPFEPSGDRDVFCYPCNKARRDA